MSHQVWLSKVTHGKDGFGYENVMSKKYFKKYRSHPGAITFM